MSSSSPLSELVGSVVAIVLALALISYMLYARGAGLGQPRAKVRRAVAALWLAVAMATAALVGVRYLIGGPLVDAAPGAGWVRVTPLSSFEWFGVAAAIAIMLGCLIWAVTAMRSVTGPVSRTPTQPDTNELDRVDSDQAGPKQ